MKKLLSVLLSILMIVTLAACGAGSTTPSSTASTAGGAVSDVSDVVTRDITAQEATGTFTMTSEDGAFTNAGGVYTITSAGTYALSGLLEGQILVEAGDEDEVILELSGATVKYGSDSPVKILSAGKVEISAKKGTENVVSDTRSAKTSEEAAQGDGAVWADCDLKLKGSGTLVVEAGYNNGVHTTKDLTIQNLSLKATAGGNAIKGNDSVTVTSGDVIAVSSNGDGIKTKNTDLNKNGVTRGDVTFTGGIVTVYAAGDGIQSAHNFEMTTGEEGTTPTVTICTGSYSSYTASNASTTSYKGVKVQNELNVKAGSITIQSYDDGLHADYGTAFSDGTVGQGTINVSGGSVSMSVYSPANKTAGGKMGRGGWGGQQSVSGADGIHADNVLNVTGGTIAIDSAYEGLEANVINVSGGSTVVAANDDGVNATKGNATPAVNVTGGFLDVTVSPSGDTDGIDSNGTYAQTGGVVITRGPSSEMAAAIDADRQVAITGGTLIVLGYGRVSAGGSVQSYNLSLHSAGTHTVTVDGVTYTFTNASSYGRTSCYSSVAVSA